MTAIQAARAAARIRRELNADVEMVRARYGEFTVVVDGQVVVDPGLKVIFGVIPSTDTIVEEVRSRLAAPTPRPAGAI